MTQMWFWLATALMLTFSLALFVVPILRGKAQDSIASRDELNKAFFRDRLNELAHEADEGLVDNQEQLQLELKKSLLDDVPAAKATGPDQGFSPWVLLPGALLLIGLSYGLYAKVGAQSQVVAWQQTAQRLPELSARLMDETQQPLTEQEMGQLVLSLRTKLQQTPNDAMGWLLLGRIAVANRDLSTALGAMDKAYRLAPDDIDAKLGYAQVLMLTGQEGDNVMARNLLRQVLAQDHLNSQAFSLLAFEAFERGDYANAISNWEMMKKLLPADDPRHVMLDRSIAKAKAQQDLTVNKN